MFDWVPPKYLALCQVSGNGNWPTGVTDGKREEPSKGKCGNARIIAVLVWS